MEFMYKNGLAVMPIFRNRSWLRKLGHKRIVQNKKITYGIRIKNLGKNNLNGIKIKGIGILPTNNSDNIGFISDIERDIKLLKSQEEKTIWFENIRISFSGGAWLKSEITCESPIKIYSWDKENKSFFESKLQNPCRRNFFVIDENAFVQNITNIILITLTIILVAKEVITWFRPV